ncbi:MAG: hypothetical protein LBF83_10700 [Spirochaetaceae bacterium]|jgi:hypothetical protein|nr:hypothetical protein [Spirochaetaceae bacterium]
MLLIGGAVAAAQTPFSPRNAETTAFNELVQRLEAKNINFTERPLMADYGAFGVSVEVNIPARPDSGGSEGEGLFVLAVPILDVQTADILNGTDGGPGWSVELALGLIDKFLSKPLPFDTLVYFAADNWPATGGGAFPYAGFQALLGDTEEREGTLIVYCDSLPEGEDAPSALGVLRLAGTTVPPLDLVEPFVQLCADSGIPWFFDSEVGGAPAPAVNTDEAGGRQIIYVTGASAERSKMPPSAAMAGKKITADEASALLYRYAEEIFRGGVDSGRADYNYACVNLKNKVVFIPELTLVLLTLFGMVFVSALFFCLYYAAKSRHKYVLIPVFAVFVLLTAAFLFVLHTNGGQDLPARTKLPAQQTKITTDGLEPDMYFTASPKSVRFLDRRIVRISTEARLPPLRYSLFFTNQAADDPAYFIYDAPMPYISDGKRIEFILGSYPPNPLDIELALPLSLNGEFSIEGLFPGNAAAVKTFTVPNHD